MSPGELTPGWGAVQGPMQEAETWCAGAVSGLLNRPGPAQSPPVSRNPPEAISGAFSDRIHSGLHGLELCRGYRYLASSLEPHFL